VSPVFSDEELRRLERVHPDGLSAAAVVELLRQRGVDLAEATFRKYVQLGLLPRSRRVGRKGKHRGSHGLYPVACVARLAEIRMLMTSGLTLEEIQRSAVAHLFEVDALRRSAHDVVLRLEGELVARGNGKSQTVRRLQTLHTQADALAQALEAATRDICPAAATAHLNEDPAAIARAADVAMRGRRPTRTAAAAGRIGRKPAGNRPGQGRPGAHR